MTDDGQKRCFSRRYNFQISTFAAILEQFVNRQYPQRLLDVGCGTGLEVIELQNHLDCQATGIDIEDRFEPQMENKVELKMYDGLNMDFADNSFDGIYSYHVLEHAAQPDRVMAEMARVLKKGGFAYIGVPNKQRILAYISMTDKSLWRRIRQNLLDYWMRLRGRFDNSAGAHAGFAEHELMQKMSVFSKLYNVTRDYYRIRWQHRLWLVRMITAVNLDRFLFPSIYILGIK